MRSLSLALPIALVLALNASPCFGEGAELGAATPAQKLAAGNEYKRGLALFNEQKYDEALAAFRASYAVVKSPNPHLMIGRTLSELQRFREAHAELEATLVEGERALATDRKYEATVQEAHAEIEALLQKTARLRIDAGTSDGSISVDGVELTRDERSEPVIVEPGMRVLVFVSADGERVERQINAEAGALVDVSLIPPPKSGPSGVPAQAEPSGSAGGRRTLAYVFGGVGLASMATFGVFAAESSAKYSDLKAACTGQRCPADKRHLAESGKREQAVANAALFVGLFALGTGAVLLWQSTGDRANESGVSLRMGAGSFSMDGRF